MHRLKKGGGGAGHTRKKGDREVFNCSFPSYLFSVALSLPRFTFGTQTEEEEEEGDGGPGPLLPLNYSQRWPQLQERVSERVKEKMGATVGGGAKSLTFLLLLLVPDSRGASINWSLGRRRRRGD